MEGFRLKNNQMLPLYLSTAADALAPTGRMRSLYLSRIILQPRPR
jgi:hypothetical protein